MNPRARLDLPTLLRETALAHDLMEYVRYMPTEEREHELSRLRDVIAGHEAEIDRREDVAQVVLECLRVS